MKGREGLKKRFALIGMSFCLLTVSACVGNEKLKADNAVEKTFAEVSVHDPAIVKGDDGEYYIFGSHLAVAKTDDLINWTEVNQGVKDNNTVIPNVYLNMKEAFEWSHSNTFWAPDVIKLKDGRYHMYYCNCKGDSPISCLGMAVSDNAQGPYENCGILLKSGMEAGEQDEDGDYYQPTTDPNTVDPNLFFDTKGRLWMVYGSYSGGIFIKEMDATTGYPLESGYGKKLLGGNHLRIEAPYIIYNEETKYYYMFLSFGGLDSDGGYNVRVCRSENPDGPYVDSMGQDMTLCKGKYGTSFSDATAQLYGTKLMGGYKFLWQEGEEGEDRKGYLSTGHNSCIYDEESQKYFIIYHTRFENSGEMHQVRVHQMFFNEDGWPVIAPYRYTGETIEAYNKEEIAGKYKWINHGRDITAKISESEIVELKKNGKISGAVTGSYELGDDNKITISIGEDTYKGICLKQWDEDGKKYVMTFSILNEATGISVWGSGLKALDE